MKERCNTYKGFETKKTTDLELKVSAKGIKR